MHHLQETLILDMPLKILVSDCSSKTEGHENRILSTNIGLRKHMHYKPTCEYSQLVYISR